MPTMSIAPATRLSYKEFCELPDDGQRYEILDGALFASPSPQTRHQRVIGRLFRMLSDHVETHDLGEVFIAPYDVLLAEHDIVEPDLVYVSKERARIVTDLHIRGVPDLLIEVLSPLRPQYDTQKKRERYAATGVPWYWLVDPQKQHVAELKLSGSDYVAVSEAADQAAFNSKLFSDLAIDLRQLWK